LRRFILAAAMFALLCASAVMATGAGASGRRTSHAGAVRYLEQRLRPQGTMVVLEARHLCVEMRGIKKPGATTVTSALRGIFLNKPVREEFLDLLRR